MSDQEHMLAAAAIGGLIGAHLAGRGFRGIGMVASALLGVVASVATSVIFGDWLIMFVGLLPQVGLFQDIVSLGVMGALSGAVIVVLVGTLTAVFDTEP